MQPLADSLEEYKRKLADFDKQHVGVLGEVKSSAEELLREQRRAQDETRRLNQLLGRSDHRGRWGEIQLANVLEASGLREDIDYELQVTSTSESGSAQRPDCVVNVSHGVHVAVDAKFPFDAFEQALASTDADERHALEVKHAKDLRAHIKTLRSKSYWEVVSPAPEFVVCFVPSDEAVSVALDADPELARLRRQRAGVDCGPDESSVVAVVGRDGRATPAVCPQRRGDPQGCPRRLRSHQQGRRTGRRDGQGAELTDRGVQPDGRILRVATHRECEKHEESRGSGHAKDLPVLRPVERLTSSIDESKWGVEPPPQLDLGFAADVVDLDDVEDEI